MQGEIIKLDRKYPLVKFEDGSQRRCEESTSIKKKGSRRCVIGDFVKVASLDDHDFDIIEDILPRKTSLIRKDPSERSESQVLAANFSQVVIMEPFDRLNLKRLERELVLAHETGAKVAVLLTKSDTVDPSQELHLCHSVAELAGRDVPVHSVSIHSPDSILELKEDLFADETSILLGQSGAGKSSLANILIGNDAQATGSVRSTDGKGRHTTVSRSIIDLPLKSGRDCRIVDMPGIKGLGLWDASSGIDHAFSDIIELGQDCRFRDCTHTSEPGCAVREAVDRGLISPARLRSYLDLREEVDRMRERKRQASWKNK